MKTFSVEKRMAFKLLPPITDGGHVGCLNCGGRSAVLPLKAVIAVGFGDAYVSRDGEVIFQETDSKKFKTLRTFENKAAKDPDHDWRVVLHGPLHGETYQRQGSQHWVLVERNQGFA